MVFEVGTGAHRRSTCIVFALFSSGTRTHRWRIHPFAVQGGIRSPLRWEQEPTELFFFYFLNPDPFATERSHHISQFFDPCNPLPSPSGNPTAHRFFPSKVLMSTPEERLEVTDTQVANTQVPLTQELWAAPLDSAHLLAITSATGGATHPVDPPPPSRHPVDPPPPPRRPAITRKGRGTVPPSAPASSAAAPPSASASATAVALKESVDVDAPLPSPSPAAASASAPASASATAPAVVAAHLPSPSPAAAASASATAPAVVAKDAVDVDVDAAASPSPPSAAGGTRERPPKRHAEGPPQEERSAKRHVSVPDGDPEPRDEVAPFAVRTASCGSAGSAGSSVPPAGSSLPSEAVRPSRPICVKSQLCPPCALVMGTPLPRPTLPPGATSFSMCQGCEFIGPYGHLTCRGLCRICAGVPVDRIFRCRHCSINTARVLQSADPFICRQCIALRRPR